MVRRLALLIVLVPVATLLSVPDASAGGSWLDVTGGQRARIDAWVLSYAAVDSTVNMRSEFSNGQLAPVSAGPWFAYLGSDDAGEMRPPLLLGPVDIATTGGYPYVATVSFTVPDVPTGYYSVTVCNLGCELIGVGDLIGGNFFVGSNSREARLGARLQILRWMHQGEAREIERLTRQLRDSRLELDQAEVASARASTRAVLAGTEAVAARTANERLAGQLNDRDQALERWRWATWLLVGALVATGVLALRLARRPRLVLPDTPSELIEEGTGHYARTS